MPMLTVIDEDVARTVAGQPEGEDLWVGARDLAATGWEQKPAGLCRGPLCIPVRAGGALLRADGAVNLVALARQRGQVVVHDEESLVWLFGVPGETLDQTRASLEAPDFTLPDLDGHFHSLSQHRGRKVLLASWASW
jgi:hypothetical protein